MSNAQHEAIIDVLFKAIPDARKFGFRKSVIETLVKYDTIDLLRNRGVIAENEIPDGSLLEKELKKSFCTSFCEEKFCEFEEFKDDPCSEKELTLYEYLVGDWSPIGEIKRQIKFLPDLFVIDEDYFTIIAIEVENTNRVSIAKLINYAFFQDYLANEEWDFMLILYDRFGNKMGFINLPIYFFAGLFNNDNMKDFSKNYEKYIEKLEKGISEKVEGEIMGYYRSNKFI